MSLGLFVAFTIATLIGVPVVVQGIYKMPSGMKRTAATIAIIAVVAIYFGSAADFYGSRQGLGTNYLFLFIFAFGMLSIIGCTPSEEAGK